MSRRPQSNYGDAPPAYLPETASFLSDVDSSPTNASRLNGATMRLLPTSGDGADDMNTSPRAPSPSHYNYDPDYDHTPYVLSVSINVPLYISPHSSRSSGYGTTFIIKSHVIARRDGARKLVPSTIVRDLDMAAGPR